MNTINFLKKPSARNKVLACYKCYVNNKFIIKPTKFNRYIMLNLWVMQNVKVVLFMKYR